MSSAALPVVISWLMAAPSLHFISSSPPTKKPSCINIEVQRVINACLQLSEKGGKSEIFPNCGNYADAFSICRLAVSQDSQSSQSVKSSLCSDPVPVFIRTQAGRRIHLWPHLVISCFMTNSSWCGSASSRDSPICDAAKTFLKPPTTLLVQCPVGKPSLKCNSSLWDTPEAPSGTRWSVIPYWD